MSYINQFIILQCDPPSPHYCTLPKKAFRYPSVWARRKYIWKLNWNEILLIYLENWQGAPCSHRQSRNRMMNTFIIVNITPICRYEIVYRINLCFLTTLKRPSVSFYLIIPFKEELADYCFILKVTRVFSIPTQAK